jgi:hypothetical protein
VSDPPSLRARWLVAVKRTRLVGPSCIRLLTEVGEHHMNEKGSVAVTQERLAATLGLSVSRVKHLFREAREAQLLDLVAPGYRGHPSIHHAMIPLAARAETRAERGLAPNPLTTDRKGVGTQPPNYGKGVGETNPLTPADSGRKGVGTQPPTARVQDRKPRTGPASLRESRPEAGGGRAPHTPSASLAALRSANDGAIEDQEDFSIGRRHTECADAGEVRRAGEVPLPTPTEGDDPPTQQRSPRASGKSVHNPGAVVGDGTTRKRAGRTCTRCGEWWRSGSPDGPCPRTTSRRHKPVVAYACGTPGHSGRDWQPSSHCPQCIAEAAS